MKLYEYSKRINRKLKDKQWDWADEEFRRLWDALYNKREQYSGQIGGGESPFESRYGATGGPGGMIGHIPSPEIFARMGIGYKINPDNAPYVLSPSYSSWFYNAELWDGISPFVTGTTGSFTLGGPVPKNYYGRIYGQRQETNALHLTATYLLDANSAETPSTGNTIANLSATGGQTKLNLLMNEGEVIKAEVTDNATHPPDSLSLNFGCWVSCLFFARWPYGETTPGMSATNPYLGTTGPGINNIRFIRLKNVAITVGVDLLVYTVPAGKVAWVDPTFFGVYGIGPTTGPSLMYKRVGLNAKTLTGLGLLGSSKFMYSPWADYTNSATNPSPSPIMEAGDQILLDHNTASGNMNIFFHVYERDRETLTLASDPLLGLYATGGTDPF